MTDQHAATPDEVRSGRAVHGRRAAGQGGDRSGGALDAADPVAVARCTAVNRAVPEATVARLPVYLRALSTLAEQGVVTVSSEELAAAAGVNSAKLRKDLSHLGSYGTRGVGYDVAAADRADRVRARAHPAPGGRPGRRR